MRMRRKSNLEARLEKCASLAITNPEAYKGKWLQAFNSNNYKELHLEIGCGKGRFVCQSAHLNPDVFFVALEKYENVLITALERAIREEIGNIRFISGLAENLADYFATGELSRIYINFCDPWPLNKHKKRRIVSSGFLKVYKELLRPGGELLFKTDNEPLFNFALSELDACGFAVSDITCDLHKDGSTGIMTEFEEKYTQLGLPIYFCNATKL